MKITKEQAQKLAIHLFELEIDSMQNNMDDFYIDLIGWRDVFGDKAKELFEATTSDPKNEFNAKAIDTISNLLVNDFEDGYGPSYLQIAFTAMELRIPETPKDTTKEFTLLYSPNEWMNFKCKNILSNYKMLV